MAKNFITIEGDVEFQQLLKLLPKQFEPRIMREIARKGGRVIVKAARSNVPGQLGSQIKKDVGVVNDRRNKSAVKVKMRHKKFPDRKGNSRIVSSIAGHFTEGVKQSSRKTKSRGQRGKVRTRYQDFIHQAGETAGPQAINVMKTESVKVIEKHVNRWRRKSR